jgi:hypothetical protein
MCYIKHSNNIFTSIPITYRDVFFVTMISQIVILLQMCNGDDFAVVAQAVMHRLADASQRIAQLHAKGDDFGWEEAEGFSSESDGYSEEGTAPPCMMRYQNIESGVIVERCKTRKGVVVKVDAVPKGILNQVQKFYICEDCGKCYWDGSHYERLVGGKLQKIVIL